MESVREFQNLEYQIYCLFLLFRVFFEVQTLFSNMAANSNGQIEGRRENFLLWS